MKIQPELCKMGCHMNQQSGTTQKQKLEKYTVRKISPEQNRRKPEPKTFEMKPQLGMAKQNERNRIN